ncbi:MAG TPA: hypothetical protein EYP34_03525, partial [Chromatiaceae bacterium]|nr:hypothetical protein [Chromatiaceae bacterium]
MKNPCSTMQNKTVFHMHRTTRARLFLLGLVMIFLFTTPCFAATTGNGPDNFITILGSGSPVGNGDYYSANNGGGLNTYYSYWIEVPPGSPNFRVDIFDADVGNNLDDALGGSFNTSVQYRLYAPGGGAPVRTATCAATCTGLNNSNADNRWRRFAGGEINNPTPGIWELQVDMSSAVTTGNDVNTFGLRVRSGDGNIDYNVFYYFNITGSLRAINPRNIVNYPYVTSGCSLGSNDYDFDVPGGGNNSSMSIASRLGVNTAISPLSAPSAWNNQIIGVEGRDDSAEDYGLGTVTLIPAHSGVGNVLSWYLNTESAATLAPASRFTLNNTSAHRIYLPTGTGNTPGGAPAKPYLAQWVRQNDPTMNPNEFTVTIRLINPTAHDIIGAVVDALVPSPVTYGGARTGFPTHGSLTVQPGVNNSGALSWTAGTVPAGQTAVLAYNITVPDPTAVTTVTGVSTSADATRAVFDDETGTPFSTGGLCELRIGPALTQAVISNFRGVRANGGALLQWDTASEVGTLGFYIEREDPATGEWSRLNDGKLIPGLGLSDPQGGVYTYLDVSAETGKTQRYRLIELEGKGNQRLYGPYEVVLDTMPEGTTVQAVSRSATPYTVTAKQPALAAERQQQPKNRHMLSEALSAGIPDGLRIGIRETGLYHLSAAQIAASLQLSEAEVIDYIGQQSLSLRNQGNEMAWLPADDGAGLYFYAEAIDSIYTQDNVVLLKTGPGVVMTAEDGGDPASIGSAMTFISEQHFEEDEIPVLTRAVKDYWFWGRLADDPDHRQAEYPFPLHGVAGGAAELMLELEGYSETKHVVNVQLNGVEIGSLNWDGQRAHIAHLAVPSGVLQEGDNTLELIHPDIPAGNSWVYFNNFDVRYPRKLAAQNGALHFHIGVDTVVTIDGLSSAAVHILRIDNPRRPVLVENVSLDVSAGGYRASFTTGGEGRFLLVEDAVVKIPAWLQGYAEPQLNVPANQADYLLVAPAELMDAARELADYRAASGLITRVVSLEEIYLSFNHGIEDPAAIRRFVDYARDHWLVAPRYLALVGDSSYDHRGLLDGVRDDHKVPALFIGTPDGMFAADNLYGAMRGNAPRVAVGRIPVRTNAELRAYLDKLQAWESALVIDLPVQLVADDADVEAGDFPADSTNVLRPEVPAALLAAQDIYLDAADPGKAHDDLLVALNDGRGLVNYLGHGGIDRLAEEGILTSENVPALANTQTPVMTALSCVVNRHALAGVDSLGEQLVVGTDAGAIAMWAPTGLSQNA